MSRDDQINALNQNFQLLEADSETGQKQGAKDQVAADKAAADAAAQAALDERYATKLVAMGYNASATFTRYKNLVTVHMNTVASGGFAAADPGNLGETVPAGYRPAYTAYLLATATAGATSTSIVWYLNTNGSMQYGNIFSLQGGTRLGGSTTYFTKDAWPTS